MDWHEIDPGALFEAIRQNSPAADAERMVWAWEQVLAGGRIDPTLFDHLAVAAICGIAYRDNETPRAVLENLFRRAIEDDRWTSDYASLLIG